MASPVKWTAIVLTCTNKDWAQALQKELEIRQEKGYIDKDVFLLTVEDPKQNVGSGGASINALLTVAEYISAQRGYTLLNPDVLQKTKILILHVGRTYLYDPCGRPFVTLPIKYKAPHCDGLLTVLDIYLKLVTDKIAVKAGPGVWVCSTDVLLTVPENADIPWEPCDAAAITVPSTPEYCRAHGVYKLDPDGFVEDIFFRENLPMLEKCERPDGKVPVVTGLVYLSDAVVEKMMSFYMKPPLDACTYFGVDSGEPPIQLSLFFDVMLSMTTKVIEEDFVSGKRSGSYGKENVDPVSRKTMQAARFILWKDLNGFKIKACMIESGSFFYPYTITEHRNNFIQKMLWPNCTKGTFIWSKQTHSFIATGCSIEESSYVINSIIEGKVNVGPKSIISHCHLKGNINIGKDSFISGLNMEDSKSQRLFNFPDSIVVQGFNINLPTLGMTRNVLTVHGRFDNCMMPQWKSICTFCNEQVLVLLARTGIKQEELWASDVPIDDQTIMTARMFPVFHATDKVGLKEVLWLSGALDDKDGSILHRWRFSWRLSLREILDLVDLKEEFNWKRYLLHLGEVASDHTNELQAGIEARTLANIADVLGCMAGPRGGLRSGPAANKSWAKAFNLLENRQIIQGVAALAKERANWLQRPDTLIRAARHYEGAAQILIRHAVMTAKQFFKTKPGEKMAMGQWVVAECPARIDISGGWSDTPPITYEHGGAVTTVALLINGRRPIGAKARLIEEPQIELVIHGESGEKKVICQELSHLEDYFQPHAPGALLKAAFVCTEIVDLKSSIPLADQLMATFGGGFELHSWTNLPHGSGLGTSSILAGAVMAALLTAAGISCDVKGLIHSVLYLEQLLTTGGGWQDQVGGLMGGVFLGLSEAKLPLYVDPVDLNIKPDIIQEFNTRLVLIYTGKTRLARNLLQDVVRNWYARNPQIVDTEDSLVELAQECAKGFIDGNLDLVGDCMSRYWDMKKLMAPGCETILIGRLMADARPYASGMCMAGAGGGGFLYVLAKNAECKELIKSSVAAIDESEGVQIYDAVVDMEGLKITVQQVWVE
ncbi:hypothetical protein ACJMK2_009860 [Sinanodonta woodiana]|uniref:L-fucose kinase n=1 Tax=Sinanodonta woodiana TaxID=1069815 RepID=A0ABD3VET3_SINWO